MSDKKNTLKVEPMDTPMWYKVESQSYPTPNEVHLEDYDGNGNCNCQDMSFTCLRNIKKQGHKLRPVDYGTKEKKNPERTRCKHVMVAIKYWSNRTLREISRELNKQ